MNRTYLLAFSLLLLASAAYAFDVQSLLSTGFAGNGQLLPEYQEQFSSINDQFQQLPTPIQGIFGNQQIKLELTRLNGQVETLGIILQNNVLVNVTRYAPENPTLLVQTTEATIMEIAQSENKAGALIQALQDGRIKYEALNTNGSATGFFTGIYVWAAHFFQGILGLFGFT